MMLMKNDLELYLEQYKEIYGNEIICDNSKIETTNTSLFDFYNSIKNCTKCSLSDTRENVVFGTGNPNAEIVIVGEAPGKNEDLQGKPFVGRGGKLLDKILNSIKLDRQDVFILNVLKCRPPKNRDPLSDEIEKCEPYLKKQLQIINPKLIIALGRISAMTLLKIKDSLKNMRNQVHQYEGIDLIVTYHPAALLRNPHFKKPTWEDFKYIRDNYLNG